MSEVKKFYSLNVTNNYVYNFLFTDEGLVFEFVGNTRMWFYLGFFGLCYMFLVGGLVGAYVAEYVSWKHYGKKSRKMTSTNIDEILSRHKKCFVIKYEDISEVFFKKRCLVFNLNQKREFLGKQFFCPFSPEYKDLVQQIFDEFELRKNNTKHHYPSNQLTDIQLKIKSLVI